MNLTYGHFKDIEQAFCAYVESIKKTDVQKSVLIVVPSGRLARRLERLIARKLQHFTGINFNTFLTLAEKIVVSQAHSLKEVKPQLSDSQFYRFLLKTILEKYPPPFYKNYTNKGFIDALQATIRDMTDARIEPSAFLKHVEDIDFDDENHKQEFLWLLKVHALYLETIKKLPFSNRTDLFVNACQLAKDCSYLQSFDEIIYYGFYDLTGLQLEFFDAVRASYRINLFLPYSKNSAYAFMDNFFKNYLLGNAKKVEKIPADYKSFALGKNIENIFETAKTPEDLDKKSLSVINVSGTKDEVWCACKEILKLKDKGLDFDEMAFAVPTLELYKYHILSLFNENKIPFVWRASQKISDTALGKFCKNIILLSKNNFNADTVLNILNSPYFARKDKEKWVLIVKLSGIKEGWHQWDRITDESFADVVSKIPGSIKLCSGLRSWLVKLKHSVDKLEEIADWKDLSQKALEIISQNINTGVLNSNEFKVYEKLSVVVGNLTYLDDIRIPKKGEFFDEFASKIENTEITLESNSNSGVQIFDPISIRGHNYKVVILAGLNEGLFPRIIREDAFLNDRMRSIIRDGFGFWIKPKLDAYMEEKLVFYLMLLSAGEKLVCLYQRSDEGGKVKVPSIYLMEFLRALKISQSEQTYISRQNISKYVSSDEKILSDREMSVKISLDYDSSNDNYGKAGLDNNYFKYLRSKLPDISSFNKAGAYDGFTGVLKGAVPTVMSATALEALSKCPMQYFLAKVLKLKSQINELDSQSLAPDKIGALYHEILMKIYSDMKKQNFYDKKDDDYLPFLKKEFENYLDKLNYKEFGLYPVVWEAKKELIKENLTDFIKDDLMILADFKPEFFEKTFTYSIDGLPLEWKGRIDRLDVDSKNKLVRVVDYKKSGVKGGANITSKVLQGEVLQPFVYMELANAWMLKEFKDFKLSESVFLNVENGEKGAQKRRQLFTSQDWNVNRKKIKKMILFLLSLVEQGKFFIRPDTGQFGRCSYCDFKNICRKSNPKVLRRVSISDAFKSRENYGS
ncbi:MAG TPA: PD-(D/E)XK nuclease family protein [Elusimicrobiales bacterium]|nr:PD-(D/E)XK nuclease family protein [Elusimicrobiales bacterium]